MKIHDCLQGSDLWLWHRLGLPTASNFDRIITPKTGKPSSQAAGYIAELIAETVTGNTGDHYMSRPMIEGTNAEPDARAWYAYARDVEVREVGFVTDDCEVLGASPDGLCGDDGGLELKCPQAATHVGYMLDPASLVEKYKCQIHGCMIVCEREWWDVMSYCPGFEPVCKRVEWDDFTEAMVTALLDFETEYAAARQRFEQANGKPLAKPPKPRVKEVAEPVWMG